MPESTVAFPFFTVPVFSLALAIGIVASVGLVARAVTVRRSGDVSDSVRDVRFGDVIDVWLAAWCGGMIGARIVHVLLNWAYFAVNLSEALRLNAGGLDWHGAVVGGLAGLVLAARRRRVDVHALLDALAPALALLAFAGWLGCWAAVCGYGTEVDTLAHYPAFAAAESRDVYGIVAPRYNTQLFGMALGLALLVASVVLARGGWLKGRRFWALLALLSAGMFGIGFLRGDYAAVVAGLRADQLIDIGFVVLAIVSMCFLPRSAALRRPDAS